MVKKDAAGTQNETVAGVGSWMICSVAMMMLNKKAISTFPYECTLTAVQMLFSVMVLLCSFRYIRFGSMRDVLRWSLVTPFFSGMLLTSMLALKHASMTLVVVFRCLSPILALPIEWLYLKTFQVNRSMLVAMLLMLLGTSLYASQLPRDNLPGIQWVFLNMLLAIGDRLLQRLMLAKEQNPVDISKAGVTLINNIVGFFVVTSIDAFQGGFAGSWHHLGELSPEGMRCVVLSCVVSVGISYTGVWAQSLISATSFLMLVNANKFIIIFMEVFVMQTLTINHLQLIGAILAVVSSVIYGHARQELKEETLPILTVGRDRKIP